MFILDAIAKSQEEDKLGNFLSSDRYLVLAIRKRRRTNLLTVRCRDNTMRKLREFIEINRLINPVNPNPVTFLIRDIIASSHEYIEKGDLDGFERSIPKHIPTRLKNFPMTDKRRSIALLNDFLACCRQILSENQRILSEDTSSDPVII